MNTPSSEPTTHHLRTSRQTTHGVFSKDLSPALLVNSGDTVELNTLDAWWSSERHPYPFSPRAVLDHPHVASGHALSGPVAVRDLAPGDTLEIQILHLEPAPHGFTTAGGIDTHHYRPFNAHTGQPTMLLWTQTAPGLMTTTIAGRPYSVPSAPFLGVMGMPSAAHGEQSTTPPRRTGGNLDCKLLTAGSSLFLPVEVPLGLLSVGDGHGAQGDGELSNNGIECAMDSVRLRLIRHVRPPVPVSAPVIRTANTWVALGLGSTLDEASVNAGNAMLDILQQQFACTRAEALGFASVAVDLRITQVVNGTRGVHAVWRTT